MGFMDKLKDVGQRAMQGTMAMAATSYGVVSGGKYKACKVSMNNANDKLIFIRH